jgi:hypothetical protein
MNGHRFSLLNGDPVVEVIDPDLIVLRSDKRQIRWTTRFVYRNNGQLRIGSDQF